MQNTTLLKIIGVLGIVAFVGFAVLVSLYPTIADAFTSLIIPSKYGSVSKYRSVSPEKRQIDLIIESRNAKIVSQEDVTLAFQLPGKIDHFFVTRGNLVQKDTVLATINKRDLELEYNRANSLLNQAKINLQKIKNGARAEDLAISSSKEKLSETTIDVQKKTLLKALEDLITVSDDTFYNKLSNTFTINQQGTVSIKVTLNDAILESTIKHDVDKINILFSSYKKNIATNSSIDIEKRVTETTAVVDAISSLYDTVAQGVNGARPEDTLIQGSRATVAESRALLSQAKLTFSSAYTNYKTAKESLSISQNEKKLLEAGSSNEDIAIAESIVQERTNQVQGIKNQLSFTSLLAPSSNMLVKDVLAKDSETVTIGEPIILLAYLGMKVQIDVEEEDIAAITQGDEGVLYLRSYKDIPVKVQVDSIEPKEIIKNESTYFRLNLELKDVPEDIVLRTGMTGDLSLKTKRKRDAVVLKKEVLLVEGGYNYLLVNENGKVSKRVVEIKDLPNGQDYVEVEGDIDVTTQVLYK